MAEKPSKKTEPAEKKDAKAGGGLLTKTPILMGGAMIIEAMVLFGGFKFLGSGSPHAAQGAELADGSAAGGKDGEKSGASTAAAKTTELPLVDFKAENKQSGRTFLYDVSIYVTVKVDDEAKVTDDIKDADALIRDRVRTIIAQSDPDKLGGGSEPGLETLRRQVKFQLDQIFGSGLVQEVLVPRCIPYRTDY